MPRTSSLGSYEVVRVMSRACALGQSIEFE